MCRGFFFVHVLAFITADQSYHIMESRLASVLERLDRQLTNQRSTGSDYAGGLISLHEVHVHVNSSDRDETRWPTPSECQLEIQELNGVQEIELVHFEIANPRNTIEVGINQKIVFAEFDAATSTYNVFQGMLPMGVFSVLDLSAALSYAMTYAEGVNTFTNPNNTYTVHADPISLQLSIHTATTPADITPREFQMHFGSGTTYRGLDITPADEQLTFSATSTPRDIWLPGHLVKIHTRRGVLQAQVKAWVDSTTVEFHTGDLSTTWGAFAFADLTPITVESAYHVPPVLCDILGFDRADVAVGTKVPILTMQNPAATYTPSPTGTTVHAALATAYDCGLLEERYIKFYDTGTFLDEDTSTFEIVSALGKVHAKYKLVLANAWNDGLTLDDGTNSLHIDIADITLVSIKDGKMNLSFETDGATLSTAVQTMTVTGFVDFPTTPLTGTVVGSWIGNIVILELEAYPFNPASGASLQLVHQTGIPLHLSAPKSFDLTLARRVIFMELKLNSPHGDGLGVIKIPELTKNTYFGRIQLDSGALNVQFLNGDRVIGHYVLPTIESKVNSLYIKLVTEDGFNYPLNGSNFSAHFKFKTRVTA